MATKVWENFKMVHDFIHPNEPIKKWFVDMHKDDIHFQPYWRSDWDTLMGLVSKCRNLIHSLTEGEDHKLVSRSDEVDKLSDELRTHLYDTDIHSVYLTSVEIIRLYIKVTGHKKMPWFVNENQVVNHG